jgi:hypothetical protein
MMRNVERTDKRTGLEGYLIYGIQVWSCAPKYILNELFKKQKTAIRLISSAKYNAHTEPLFKTLDILPLPSLIQYFQLQFMQQLQQKFLPDIFSEAWIYKGNRRKLNCTT